jgi:hypothetical protein
MTSWDESDGRDDARRERHEEPSDEAQSLKSSWEDEALRKGASMIPDEGLVESTSMAVRILQAVTPYEKRSGEGALLQTLSRIMEVLISERRMYVNAEEGRRSAEVERARLEGLLVAESKLRSRAEREVAQLKQEIKEREAQALARVQHEENAYSHRERVEHLMAGDPDGSRPANPTETEISRARKSRLEGELRMLERSGESKESTRRTKEDLERPMGGRVSEPGVPVHMRMARVTDPARAAPTELLEPPVLDKTADEPGEPAPLPPGWSYAEDLLVPKRRWPFSRARKRPQSP